MPDLSERLYYTDADTNQKYHFTGWQNKNAVNETEKTIKPVYNVNDLGDGHVLNIEAQYEKVYDVIFHQKNEASSGIFESITITEGQAMGTKFPKEHPLLESKTFVGWTKIPGGTSVDPSITKESIITENTDYYPVYKEADGTITFKMNDGSGKNFGNPAGIAYNDLITRPAENPVWPGYDFMGWSDKAEKVLEKDQTFDDLLGEGNTLRYDGEHEDIDYFAVWRMHPYTLDFIVRPDRPGDPHIKIEDIPYGTEIGNKMPKDPAGYTDEKGQKYQFSHWVDEKKNHVDQNTHYTVDQITNDKEIITAVYNKVYDVTGTKYGHGNIKSGTGTFVEGSRTTVFWEPDAGYRVTKVMVDYRVRDDLLASGKGGSITFDPITENHRIHVEFSKKDDGGED
ncbi:MAG: InlB B-repeat-containing protein, partial [Eubacterium sp.]